MSTKDMTLTQLKHTSKVFDDTHTIAVKGFKNGKGGPRKPGSKNKITLANLAKTVEDLAKIVQDGFVKQEKFNRMILDRFDNLVAKNNLNE